MMIWWERKIVTITSVTAIINFFVSTLRDVQVFRSLKGGTQAFIIKRELQAVYLGWMKAGCFEALVNNSYLRVIFFFLTLKAGVIVANWSHSSVKQLLPDITIILLFRCSLHCCVTERSWQSQDVTDQVNELLCDLPFPFDMELL